MSLEMIRIDILKDIINLYQNTDQYETLMQLLSENRNIVHLLRSEAVVYVLLMTNSRLVWNDNGASYEYGELLARYQKGNQLYEKFAYYFMGAIVTYPSLELTFDSKLKDYSLLEDEKIDYAPLLENIDLSVQMKLA